MIKWFNILNLVKMADYDLVVDENSQPKSMRESNAPREMTDFVDPQ